MIIYSIGPISRPFEPARGKDARREEDEFMQRHGGRGSRLVYLGVEWLASLCCQPRRMLRKMANGVGWVATVDRRSSGKSPAPDKPVRTHLPDAGASARG